MLSGGERRMLAIDRVYQSLQHLKREGVTILLVEETIARVHGLADRVHLISHGQIVVETTPDALASDKRLTQTYLG
jgi:ABC-type branched-subunit amino acid transport system ATPase component